MPTYRNRRTGEIRTVESPDELRQPVPSPETAAPSKMSRLKDFLTSRGTLATAGTLAGLALAPQATIPAMLYGAAGGALGSLASEPFREETPSPGQVATDIGLGAAEGAAGPVLGPAMRLGGRAVGAVEQAIPRFARTRIGPLVERGGSALESLIGKVKGSARPFVPQVERALPTRIGALTAENVGPRPLKPVVSHTKASLEGLQRATTAGEQPLKRLVLTPEEVRIAQLQEALAKAEATRQGMRYAAYGKPGVP